MNNRISIVIPVFNEHDNVLRLHEEISLLAGRLEILEIIFIDDGSTDGSIEILRELTRKDPKVKLIVFARNYGQTPAMGAGIRHASGDIIVPLDADLQNPPAEIPRLIAKLNEGHDVVSGWRQGRHDGFLRVTLSQIANRLIGWTTGVRLHDYGCTLKAYRASVVKDIDFFGEMHRLIPVYAVWHGARVTELPVAHRPRTSGSSKYGFGRIFKVCFDLLVAKYLMKYGQKPIYFFGWLGIGAMGGGFTAGILAIFLRLYFHISLILTPLPLLSALLILVGIQFISMGLIADTVLRTRPDRVRLVYSIKERVGFEQ